MLIKNPKALKSSFIELYEQAKQLLEYGPVVAEVRPFIDNRSKEQNDYYYRLCAEIAKCCRQAGVDDCNKYTIHNLNKEAFGIDSTKDMSKEDFCDYITEVTYYWQNKTNNCWVPSENPRKFLRERGY